MTKMMKIIKQKDLEIQDLSTSELMELATMNVKNYRDILPSFPSRNKKEKERYDLLLKRHKKFEKNIAKNFDFIVFHNAYKKYFIKLEDRKIVRQYIKFAKNPSKYKESMRELCFPILNYLWDYFKIKVKPIQNLNEYNQFYSKNQKNRVDIFFCKPIVLNYRKLNDFA